MPAPAWSILDHACLSCHQRRFNPRTHRMRMAWALALCLPGVISAWLAPAAPPARFIHQRRVAALAFAPRMSAGPGEERQSGAKKLSPLIASLVESLVEKPRPTVRQPLSASDMVQLSVDAKAAASPESLAGQRRNFLLAVASPIVGAAAFASSRSRVGDPSPTDPLAILQAMERKSPTIQAALQSTRPTLVEFYGRNCPNCRAMAPDMNKLENQFHDRVNFVVLDAEKPEYASIVNLFKVCLCVRPCLRRARVFMHVCTRCTHICVYVFMCVRVWSMWIYEGVRVSTCARTRLRTKVDKIPHAFPPFVDLKFFLLPPPLLI